MEILIVANIGSTSKKYACYTDGELCYSLHIEHDPKTKTYHAHMSPRGESRLVTKEVFNNAFIYFIERLEYMKHIASVKDVTAILIRIVAPGTYFQQHHIMDDTYCEKLDTITHRAELHIALQRQERDYIFSYLSETESQNIPIYAISDSAFHCTLPKVAYQYGIARDDATLYDIRRFGYHGLSCSSLVRHIGKKEGDIPEHIIICHLGGGASITAVKKGESVDTSMGTTPMAGLLMAERTGDIDPGALLILMEEKGWGVVEARNYLQHQGGLLGVSGISNDIRVLLEKETVGVPEAEEALNLYAYRIAQYIGAYTAILGGCDMIVFSGTVGERSAPMRARVLNHLKGLGVRYDADKNELHITDNEYAYIETSLSNTKLLVAHTDEFIEMVHAYRNLTRTR